MLPSQNARPTESRAHMYRRGKGKPWLAIAGGAIVLVLGIVAIKLISGRGEPASADAGTAPLQSKAGAEAPNNKPNPAPTVSPAVDNGSKKPTAGGATGIPTKEPEKISMGGQLPGANANQNSGVKPPLAPPSGSKPPTTPHANPGTSTAQTPTRTDLAGGAVPKTVTPQAPANAPDVSNAPVSQRVQLGLDLIKQNKPVEARKMLSDALNSQGVSNADGERIRAELTKLNDRLVFGQDITAGDPFVTVHAIEPGEALAKLPKKLGLSVDWRFLQRINQIGDPAKIRAGQRIKVIRGPFHAIIDKRTFRLDLYMGDFSDRVYVRSFTVGLGEYGATPEGAFVVKPESKLVNPAWTNPRTGEHFTAEDPKNPLGHYWIGLIGASDNIRGLESYGIHGTIDPASVGQERSMGCVRLLADDIKLLYEVLMDNVSRVEIHGNDWP